LEQQDQQTTLAPHDTLAKTTSILHTNHGVVQGSLPARASRGWEAISRHLSWLVAARFSLLAFIALALVLYVVGTPVYFDQLHTLHTACTYECLTPNVLHKLHMLSISITTYAVYWVMVNLLFALVYFMVAALIFWRRSDDRIGLLASFFLVALGASFPDIPGMLASVHPLWRLPVAFVGAFELPSLAVFFFLFPNGRFVPRWTRWVACGFAVVCGLRIFFPDSLFDITRLPRLFMLPIILAVFGSMLFAQIHRYRRVSNTLERQQTKWVVFGATIALLGFLLLGFLPPLFINIDQVALLPSIFLVTSIYLILLLIPLSIASAILRSRLWDIDLIINRTLVYGMLTTCVIALYVLVIFSLGTLLQAQGNFVIALLATGLVAVIFQPLRERLQKMVNRLLYGERDDPYGVLSRLGQQLEATLAPDAVLPMMTQTIARALKLPYVAVTLRQEHGFTLAASSGLAVDKPLRVPLIYHLEQIGELLFAPRTRGELFTSAERRLLDDLACQVGIAVHAVRLTTDLRRSREHLITTREEERRRLRRNLHDGLGPTLAGLSLKVGAVHNLLLPGQEAAEILLSELSAEIETAVADIRRIVYDLRPPSLDELGLVGAIRARAAQYSTYPGTLNVLVEVPEALPALPAAIEVAVYRIVQEALTNVVRHAQAETCRILLSVSGEVYIEIIDDGKGFPEQPQTGVGLFAMSERALELGGTCVIEAVQPCGIRVYARLPLEKE
jgi:signal transduction histidine kinase